MSARPPLARRPTAGRGAAPTDQADGLRRLFAGRGQRLLALVANAHVPQAAAVLERVTGGLLALGRQVLVVDAALTSPPPPELARLELAAAVEMLRPDLSYLPARGLPLAHVDTRGSEASFLDALERIAPDADCVLLHAEATDLARMLTHKPVRPMLLGADDPQSIFAAYGACKLLAQRCALMSYDLLLVADPAAQRLPSIATSLARSADGFLGAVLHDWTVIDPDLHSQRTDEEALQRLLAAQLALEPETLASPLHGWPAAAPMHASTHDTAP